jgi:hypothetical protein
VAAPAFMSGDCIAQQQPKPPERTNANEPLKPADPAGMQVDKAKDAKSDATLADKVGAKDRLPVRYQSLLAEAIRRFQLRDFSGALAYVDQADELLPPTAYSLSVRGAVAIERREFDRGERYCRDALKIDPDFFEAKFNLCEIPFLRGDYAQARERWGRLQDEAKRGEPAVELLVYRIFLTFLLEDNRDMAREWMEKLPFPSMTPAYQYAHAAWERHGGNRDKWDEWLRSAAYILPKSKRSEFEDVLIQLNWLKER